MTWSSPTTCSRETEAQRRKGTCLGTRGKTVHSLIHSFNNFFIKRLLFALGTGHVSRCHSISPLRGAWAEGWGLGRRGCPRMSHLLFATRGRQGWLRTQRRREATGSASSHTAMSKPQDWNRPLPPPPATLGSTHAWGLRVRPGSKPTPRWGVPKGAD